MADLFSLENEVFAKFAFYAGAVLLKTVAMSLWTSRYRIPRGVYNNPEDYKITGKEPSVTADPDVERVRRCHLNDLENVIPFVLLGLLYVTTKPEVATATLVFRLFAGARFIHTFVYVNAVPQPSRTLAFTVGLLVNLFMGYKVLSNASY